MKGVISRSETEESTEARYVLPITADSGSNSDQSPDLCVEHEIRAEQKRKLAAEMLIKQTKEGSPGPHEARARYGFSPSPPESPVHQKVRAPTLSAERKHMSSIDIYRKEKTRIDSTSSADTVTEEDEDNLRRVRFGSCKIHPYEQAELEIISC